MLLPRKTLRTPADLAESGLIAASDVAPLGNVAERYAIAITPTVADLIDPQNSNDPIARQFVPNIAELRTLPHERADPIGDERHSPVPGIVHRYPDRVLFKITHLCPVYCRFCFRRESVGPGKSDALSAENIDAALNYIAAHSEIWEVILTGGDPLVLSPKRLNRTLARLAEFSHVKILRWHTRVPVVDPAAISDELVRVMKSTGKTNYVVLHANHPRELSDDARRACARLIEAGIPMLSQSVLLRGVNDNIETLEALMRALVETRIKPYYFHHLDPAPGTEEFRVPIATGQALMRELHARGSGLCQPDYVVDIPGGYAKARLREADIDEASRLRDAEGAWHDYRGA